MNRNVVLTAMSVLTIVLLTVHVSSDMILGLDRMKPDISIALTVVAFWLYAILVMPPRLPRYIVLLLGSFIGAMMPVIHTRGRGITSELVARPGGFLFVWVLLAVGITATLAFGLSLQGIWNLRRDRPLA